MDYRDISSSFKCRTSNHRGYNSIIIIILLLLPIQQQKCYIISSLYDYNNQLCNFQVLTGLTNFITYILILLRRENMEIVIHHIHYSYIRYKSSDCTQMFQNRVKRGTNNMVSLNLVNLAIFFHSRKQQVHAISASIKTV